MTWIAGSIQNNMAMNQEVNKDRQTFKGMPLGTMARHHLIHNSRLPPDKPRRDLSHPTTKKQRQCHFIVSVPT